MTKSEEEYVASLRHQLSVTNDALGASSWDALVAEVSLKELRHLVSQALESDNSEELRKYFLSGERSVAVLRNGKWITCIQVSGEVDGITLNERHVYNTEAATPEGAVMSTLKQAIMFFPGYMTEVMTLPVSEVA